MNWFYEQPVKIIFGNGCVNKLAELAGGKKCLLITSPFFAENGLAEKISSSLGNCPVFSGISENPDVSEVNECSRVIRSEKTEYIIALGGGSVMDLAKAASLGAESIEIYHSGGEPVPESLIPIIAVPTTAGTGSEVTCVAVLTDRKKGRKSPIVSESFYPDHAVIDPELTFSLPPYITASTGIDVLCHAIEGYWSRGHQPICDALAVHAARLVFDYLPKAYKNGSDAEAREKMAEASVIAGLAFTLPKTTASHACSFPLTTVYGIPHGEACGLTLDYFARVNAADERTQRLAVLLGFKDADDLADNIYHLKKKVGLRLTLSDFNLSEEKVNELVKFSHHPNMNNNPVEITDEILYDLYKNYLKGGQQNV